MTGIYKRMLICVTDTEKTPFKQKVFTVFLSERTRSLYQNRKKYSSLTILVLLGIWNTLSCLETGRLSCMLAVFRTNLTVGNIDASSLLLLLFLTLQLRKHFLYPTPTISETWKPIKVLFTQGSKTCYSFQVHTPGFYPSASCTDTHGIMRFITSPLFNLQRKPCYFAHAYKELLVNHSLQHSTVVFCWEEVIKEAKQCQGTANSHLSPQRTNFYMQRSTKSIWQVTTAASM